MDNQITQHLKILGFHHKQKHIEVFLQLQRHILYLDNFQHIFLWYYIHNYQLLIHEYNLVYKFYLHEMDLPMLHLNI